MEGVVIMFDSVSFILGKKAGGGTVIIEGGEDLTFTDDGEGNITIEEENSNG